MGQPSNIKSHTIAKYKATVERLSAPLPESMIADWNGSAAIVASLLSIADLGPTIYKVDTNKCAYRH